MSKTMAGRREVQIPTALPHQNPILKAKVRFKAIRAGRRWGKSRLMFRAAVTGHGPGRCFKGIGQGGNVIWLAPDYPQSKAIWEEEIRPRFSGARGVKLNDSERTVLLPNRGRLEIRSAEAVDGIRGRKLDGLLVDEAAFMEFFYAWRRVLRPTLTDLGGWSIVASTTEIGSDFNNLMREVEAGTREGWEGWRGTPRDNPKLSKVELDLLYAEYPPGGSDMLQELEAELLDAHGALFKEEYFKWYQDANRYAMWVDGLRYPWREVVLYVDLASSLKQENDFTVVTACGISAWPQKAGVLDCVYDHLEGPAQLDLIAEQCRLWTPDRVVIEAVAYQATAIQHLRARLPHVNFEAAYPDKDKRSRAVPVAAAMARGEVFFPQHASWTLDMMKQAKKFPNGKTPSRYIEDHDDIVDTLSMLGLDLLPDETGGGGWAVRKVVR